MSFDKPKKPFSFDKFKKPSSFERKDRPPFERKDRPSSDRPFGRKDGERKSFSGKSSDRPREERRSFSDKFSQKSDRFRDGPPARKSFEKDRPEALEAPSSGSSFFRADKPLEVSHDEEKRFSSIKSFRPSEARPSFVLHTEALESLALFLNQHHLSEIDYKDGGVQIRLSRQAGSSPALAHGPVVFSQTSSVQVESHLPSAPVEAPKGTPLVSPIVGTAYVSSKPGEPPFVKVGDIVEEGQAVLIVEAMKVMNTLKAPVSGVVKSILIKDGSPVEYGQELMYIE